MLLFGELRDIYEPNSIITLDIEDRPYEYYSIKAVPHLYDKFEVLYIGPNPGYNGFLVRIANESIKSIVY